VGTQNVYVGDAATTFYNWSAGADEPLPFTLAVEDFRLLHYPIKLRVQFELQAGGVHETELRVGQIVPVPDTQFRVRIESFDSKTGNMVYWVGSPTGESGPYSKGREDGAPLRTRPLAFRDPQVRRAEAVVTLSDSDGETLARHVIAINDPLVYRGIRIFLTAWDRTPEGFLFAGFQIVRDPGQPLVWVGAAALSLGLLLLLFGDGTWVREEGAALLARSTGGKRSLGGLGELESTAPKPNRP
jgi:cytochrome c biogenesis protein